MFSTQSTGFNLGAPAATTSSLFSGFGTNTTTTTASGGFPGFGLSSTTGVRFGQPTSTMGFGSSSGGFGMFSGAGTAAPAAPIPTLTLNQPGQTATSSSAGAATASSTSTFTGLGGAPSSTGGKTSDNGALSGAGDSGGKSKSLRDQPVPPELIPLIENMKKFLEKQKQIRDENAHEHFYLHPILEIGTTVEDVLKVRINKLDVQIQKNAKAIEALKKDTNKLLANGELVYRISRLDLPLSNSAEVIAQNNFINAKTHQYFMEQVENFQRKMAEYSEQIQILKSYCATSNEDHGYSLDDINRIIRKQHENFVSLASKIYLIHEQANKLRAEAARNKNQAQFSADDSMIPANNASRSPVSDHFGPTPFLATPSRIFGTSAPTQQAPAPNIYPALGGITPITVGANLSFGKNKRL